MPGVPTSIGCRNCKARKIKCDLNWPTCAGCRRSKKTCPGPSAKLKWMDGTHGAPQACKGQLKVTKGSSKTESQSSIVQISSFDMQSGAAYGTFRMTSGPRAPLTASSDRLGAQLVRYLQKDPERSVLRDLSFLEHIPKRLSESPALRDSIALFCSAWYNFRRGTTEDELAVTCSRPYGKALTSVQRALLSSDEQLKCETLAAVTILDKYELLFDRAHIRERKYGLHTQGLHTLMMKRGPPNMEDDLDVHLTVGNQPTLMMYEAVKGCENHFMSPEWQASIEAAKKRVIASDENGHVLESYDMALYFQMWGVLVQEAKSIYQSPDGEEKTVRAVAHYENLSRLWVETLEDFDDIMGKSFNLGAVWQVTDTTCPGGVAYDFKKVYFCALTSKMLSLKMIMSEMACDVLEFLGHPNAAEWKKEAGKLSAQACMLIPYLRRQGPIAAMLQTNPLFLAAKGAEDQAQLEYALDFLAWVNLSRQTLPPEVDDLKATVLSTVSAMTGREHRYVGAIIL